jgi:hypothetical protein
VEEMNKKKENEQQKDSLETAKSFKQLWNVMYQSERTMYKFCNDGSLVDLENLVSEIQRGEHKEDFIESDLSAALTYLITAIQFKKGTFDVALKKAQICQEYNVKVSEAVKTIDNMIKDLKDKVVPEEIVDSQRKDKSKDYVA